MLQLRLILGGALLLGAFAVISVATFFNNREAYYTVDELFADLPRSAVPAAGLTGGGPSHQRLVVRGDIDRASVDRSADGLTTRFVVRGKDHALQVEYRGLVPDTFDRATQATVGGRLGPDGGLVADQLSVQCPAKYEAVPPGATMPASAPRG